MKIDYRPRLLLGVHLKSSPAPPLRHIRVRQLYHRRIRFSRGFRIPVCLDLARVAQQDKFSFELSLKFSDCAVSLRIEVDDFRRHLTARTRRPGLWIRDQWKHLGSD